jgi:hypothetical protein
MELVEPGQGLLGLSVSRIVKPLRSKDLDPAPTGMYCGLGISFGQLITHFQEKHGTVRNVNTNEMIVALIRSLRLKGIQMLLPSGLALPKRPKMSGRLNQACCEF